MADSKCWKKRRNDKYQKSWVNDGEEVVAYGYNVGNNKHKWSSSVFDEDDNVKNISGSKLVSKQNAIKKARDYMKKNGGVCSR